MRGTMRISVVVGLFGLLATGCVAPGQARYVYQDGQYGVVGIPENTDEWPTHYRVQAETLMSNHFPEGYEIVRAEEVDSGTRTLTVNGSNTAEIDAGGGISLIKLAKIGRTSSKVQADNLKIKECRIVYKKVGAKDPEFGFAESATLGPEPYLDPNAEARKHTVARPALPDPNDPKSAESRAKAKEAKEKAAPPDAPAREES